MKKLKTVKSQVYLYLNKVNKIVIPKVEKTHHLFDSFNVNTKEPINFEGASNIFPSNRNETNENHALTNKYKSNKIKLEGITDKNKEYNENIENSSKIINSESNNVKKLPQIDENLGLDEKNDIGLRGEIYLKKEEKGKKKYKNNSNDSSLNNLLIVNNPPLTEHTSKMKLNDISHDSEEFQEKKIFKASSQAQLKSDEKRKRELLVGANLSEKLKNFDLSNNEDFNELFKDDVGVDAEDGIGNQAKRKKKKNIISTDEKYRDLKTTEYFSFYSSNIFSKKTNIKK